MPKAEFSKQGNYLWSLICQAGWDKKHSKILKPDGKPYKAYEALLMKQYKTTHINALNEYQIRSAIATMKHYADKAKQDACKPMRSGIMAMVRTHGQTADWLHDMMGLWGLGDSLRALGFADLVAVRENVMKALGVQTTIGFIKPNNMQNILI